MSLLIRSRGVLSVIVLLAVGMSWGVGAARAGAAGGYDVVGCKPSRAHPFPVVLLPGGGGDGSLGYLMIGPALAKDGYCAFRLAYGRYKGNYGYGPIAASADQLARFVKHLLKTARTRKVAIVAHSEGGLVARYYAKYLGGGRTVSDLIGLATPNHGSTNPKTKGPPDCPACREVVAGSAFLRRLNAGTETPGDVDYTMIASTADTTVTPLRSVFLSGRPARRTNVLIQQQCPADHPSHAALLFDAVALQWIENALARRGPADPQFRPRCP